MQFTLHVPKRCPTGVRSGKPDLRERQPVVARRFHRTSTNTCEMPFFEISTERQAVKQTNQASVAASLGANVLQAIAVCDVTSFTSRHISDEERLRFQMGVGVYGSNATARRRRGVPLGRSRTSSTVVACAFAGERRSVERDRATRPVRLPGVRVCGQSISPLSSEPSA